MEEKHQKEFDEWKTRQLVNADAEVRLKETQLREKLVKERDAEIEMVIQRLEVESSSSSGDVIRRHRMDVEKQRVEHAEEIKQVRFPNSPLTMQVGGFTKVTPIFSKLICSFQFPFTQ